jgi:hypothetical protein
MKSMVFILHNSSFGSSAASRFGDRGKRLSTENAENIDWDGCETGSRTTHKKRGHSALPDRGSGLGDQGKTIIHRGHREHRLRWLRDGQPHHP